MIFSINTTPVIRKVRNPPAPEIKSVPPDNTQSQMFLRMGMVDRIKGATSCDSCKGSK